MPVSELQNSSMKVKKLRIEHINGKTGISFQCADAMAFTVCLSSKEALTSESELLQMLSEDELLRLYEGECFEKNDYWFYGVTQRCLRINRGVYSEFKAVPPENIQVWSMYRAGADVTLYVPKEPADQMIPLKICYTVNIEPKGPSRSELLVEIDNLQKYEDGALRYKVNDHLPIPLPSDAINHPILLNANNDDKIQVIVNNKLAGLYERKE